MKKFIFLPTVFFLFTIIFFFRPFFFDNKLPIPSDTIVGLYFPFRDIYAKEYPRGIPFKNFQITDPVRQQYPWKTLSINVMKKVELPLWNPYNFSGTPLLANFQSAVFYPLNLLFFVFPLSVGWSIFIAFQPLLAMIFMYLFLRNLRLSIVSSIFGSLSFAFCGFFVSWMEWGNVVNTGLWLPLTLLSIDKLFQASLRATFGRAAIPLRLLRSFAPRNDVLIWSFIFIISLTFSFFAGHLQIFFYMFVVSFFYLLARWFQFGRHKNIFFLFLILAVCFLLLTFIQWLPTLQFIMSSARNLDQDWHNPGWFLPWQNLTQLIAPDFFGNPSTLNYWGIWNYGEFIGYIGFIPLLLAMYAILFAKRKIVWFFMIVFFISLLFALPTIVAKIPFKFSIPFLSTSQPTRLLYLADISLSILAAFGLEYFLRNKKWIFVPLSIMGMLLLLLWAFVSFNSQLPDIVQTTKENLLVTKNNLKLPTLFFGISFIVFTFSFIFGKKIKYAQNILVAVILLITIFDLYRFTGKYITFAEEKYLFPQTKILSFLQKQKTPFRVISTDSRVFPPNFSIVYKIQTPDGYDPLFTKRYAELSAAISRGEPNITPPFGFNRIITLQRAEGNIINLLNIKYILALSEINSPQFKKVMTEGETILYENRDVFPRAFFVNQVIVAKNNQEAINKLFENRNNLKSVAIVETNNLKQKTVWIKEKNDAKVVIKKYDENNIIINTKNRNEGFLVFTDSFYPTWHAKICSEKAENCQETPIYLTNYNFRGIVVPPGNHSIEFYNTLL